MNVSKITASMSATVPTQPYGNVVFSISWEASLDPGESPQESTQAVFAQLRAEIAAMVTPIARARLGGIEEMLLSLPSKEREALRARLGALEWLTVVTAQTADDFANRQDGQ